MLLLSAFGCAFMAGLNNGYLSLKASLDMYILDGGYPDAMITTDVIERKRMEAILGVPGVKDVNARLVGDLMMISPGGRYLSIRVMSFDEDDFQQLYIWDRADPGDLDPVFLECNFAKNNGIQAGDTIQVWVRNEYRSYAVAGLVSRVETLAAEFSDEISIDSNDFGYAYAPRALLEKEINPDYQAAFQEWQEKSSELADAEQSARQDYESALEQLNGAETELAAKKAELAQKRQETEEQLLALSLSRKKLENVQKELDEKKKEAENNQQELTDKKAEAETKKAELEQAQADLSEKRTQLEKNEQTLTEQYADLQEKKAEAEKQLSALQTPREELLAGREELDNARMIALDKRMELNVARAQLKEKRKETEELLSLLRLAKTYYAQIDEDTRWQNAEKSVYEALQKTVLELEEDLSDLEAHQRRLGQTQEALARIDAVLSEMESRTEGEAAALREERRIIVQELSAFGITEEGIDGAMRGLEGDISQKRSQLEELKAQLSAAQDPAQLQKRTEEMSVQLKALLNAAQIGENDLETSLDDAVTQAEEGLEQIDNAVSQIETGIYEIGIGLKQANEKEQEIDDGLRQIQDGEDTLRDALAQMDEGLKQMDEGLRQLSDGHTEINGYQDQIDSGFAELNEGLLQIGDYQAQLDDGFKQIADGQSDIISALDQIQEGEMQIREGIADAERQLAESEKELSEKRAEVENGWIDALAEFADIKSELQRAAGEIAEWEGYQALCNQFLLRFSPGVSRADVLKNVLFALRDVGIQKTVLYEDSAVKHRIDDNMLPMETMSNYIPLFFFGIAMVVVYLFMALMIRQCRREIGILRALGFSKARVVSLFCGVAFLVSLGAIALGFFLSLGVRGYLCHYFYDQLFRLPVRTLLFNWPRFFFSAVITIFVVVLSTFISAFSIGSVQPSEAMTRQSPSTVQIPRAVQRLTRRMSPFLKISIVSLLRNKLRFVFSSFCLAGSVMLIFISFSLVSSSNEILDQLFERCIHYDCQIFIRPDAGEDFIGALSALPCVSSVESMDYYTVSFSRNGRSEKATVSAVQDRTELISVEDGRKRPIPITGNGVILEKHLAENLRAAPGDLVWVNGVPLSVSAVSEQNGSRLQYITDAQAPALGGSTLRSLICRVAPENENELMRFLVEREDVLYASFTRSAYAAYAVILSGTKIISIVLICMAMAIGLVIVLNTSQTNLLEQKKELCILRTLGLQHRENARYWFAQSVLHFAVSCIFGFPGGVLFTEKALQKLELSNRTYPFVNSPRDYVLTAAVVLGYIVFSHFLTVGSMKKWDIVETVKEKE